MGLYQVINESAAGNAQVDLFDGAGNALDSSSGDLHVKVDQALPAGNNNIGNVDVESFPSPASSALTQVATSASSVSVLASNAARKGLILVNATNKICYIAFAATSSTTAFTVKLTKDDTYEMNMGVYTGAISAIFDAVGTGNLMVTELS